MFTHRSENGKFELTYSIGKLVYFSKVFPRKYTSYVKKEIVAAGESMELSNARQEMNDLQDYINSLEDIFPRKYVDLYVDQTSEDNTELSKGEFNRSTRRILLSPLTLFEFIITKA